MPKSDELHLRLLETVGGPGMRLSLAARLFDPDIGMPDNERIRIFIPDLHMISKEAQRRFPGYGFNSYQGREPTMVRFLERLGSFGRQLPDVNMLSVYQLGDFVDLWREHPIGNDPSAIVHDNARVWDLLYNGLRNSDSDPLVPINYLRGNHDFGIPDQSEYRDWQRAYFSGPMAVIHGDVFDWLEVLAPDWLQQAIVYLTGVQAGERNYSQAELEDVNETIHKRNETSPRYQWAEVYRLGTQWLDLPADGTGPTAENVIKVQDPSQGNPDRNDLSGHELMGRAHELVAKLAAVRQREIRLLVIGHTHHARIVQYKTPDQNFVLMDCGAWVEECWVGPKEDRGGKEPSQQIGVVVGNDCRLYQVSLPY
jgi:UDP-2,3-diacylglucosamine pyrophosphatase LpxH